MSAYKEYKSLNLPEIEQEVLQFWKERSVFEKSVSNRAGKAPFVFYEGPPSANGMPGIHHVMARTIKDLFCRYKTLQGFQVNRKSGWDTHGLPVELSVEKNLGITKEDIGKKISIEDYNAECRREVLQYKDAWEDLTHKMGYWVDLEHPYITYDNNYIETLWWALKTLFDKGLLYEGYTIQPYSPAAGTGLSTHELNQPGTYKLVKDTTVVAQFKVVKDEKSKFLFTDETPVYFLAWTTTPWTLPSNTALTVGGDIKYLVLNTTNKFSQKKIAVVFAKELLLNVLSRPQVESLFIEDYLKGKHIGGDEDYDGIAKIRGADTECLVEVKRAADKEALDDFQKVLVKHSYSKGIFCTIPNTPDELKKKHSNITFYSLESLIEEGNIKVITGKNLDGIKYEQLLPFEANKKEKLVGEIFKVILGDFVTTVDGTGIVHTAPSFGADDFRMAKKYGLASLTLVDTRGRFIEGVGEFSGEYIKEQYLTDEEKGKEIIRLGLKKYLSVDKRIAIKLKDADGAFDINNNYEHSYPHCWRTDKPVIYYPLDSWFIKTTAAKDRLVELNKTINWKPESTGTGRFGNWLENLQDWNLSRSRFWGTPLPLWKSEDESEVVCIGSVEELKQQIKDSETNAKKFSLEYDTASVTENLKDLHRPYIDRIYLISKTGKKLTRIPDLVDVWFDSGAMPYAQWHYPFENKEIFEKNFPADFIAEGVDQTRGWFFTLHTLATLLFDSVAYKNVVSNGLVLDKTGNKMSKRLGNAVDPFSTIEKNGADATRWYMISNAQPWDNLKFDIGGIDEVRRKFFGTLYNTYSFFALYANIDKFSFKEKEIPLSQRPEIDRWIISLLNTLTKSVEEDLNDYEPTKAARSIQDFVDEHLSNWYVRLCRRRFWKGDYSEDKIAAYQTLYNCLETIAKLMSPIAPFFADFLFRNLNSVTQREKVESVHLSDFPKVNESTIDKSLEERMQLAQDISSLVLSLRKKVNIKVRQPLNKILIPVLSEDFQKQVEKVSNLILSEVNVKQIEFITETEGVIKKKVKANFKMLGQKLGKQMKAAADLIAVLDNKQILELEKNGSYDLMLDGEKVNVLLTEVEVISEDIPGWQVANKDELTVALDITISEELKQEGIARELVNRIQKFRKDSNFNVTDKIRVLIERKPQIDSTLIHHKDYICAEILADELQLVDSLDIGEIFEVNDFSVKAIITLKK